MRSLHFTATTGKTNVARQLSMQANDTLWPFHSYLRQAIHAAKSRQTQYQLPWAPVTEEVELRLEALNRRWRIPRPEVEWVVRGWSSEVAPAEDVPLVVNQRRMVSVRSARRVGDAFSVEIDGVIGPDEPVMWAGQAVRVEKHEPTQPASVIDAAGKRFEVVAVEEDDGRHWILTLAGRSNSGPFEISGREVAGEPLGDLAGLSRVVDSAGGAFELTAGTLKVADLPAQGELRGDNGVAYRWSRKGGRGRKGIWIQLLPPPEISDDWLLDPRAAFCEDDVREVWTQPRHSENTVIKVKRVDRERYQLLVERMPPRDADLYLPVDIRNLQLQRRALRQLAEVPLPHHRALLRLIEKPDKVNWPHFRPRTLSERDWAWLTDLSRDGTDEQRAFVSKALETKDIAFLEGPPGSGKTTAICELVEQLLREGKRVLMCASTHVAIDNVLERLLDREDTPVDAVRIGRTDKVDRRVVATQIDTKVEALVMKWRELPHFRTFGDDELEKMATRTVVAAANLTCGTTMGIARHPLFDDRSWQGKPYEQPITTYPHWDVLIVDEASKTTVPEFMVSALMARRWIVVGDVRQLPPFSDRAHIVANLRSLRDKDDKEVFKPEHQQARLLLFRLFRHAARRPGVRWLIVEKTGVIAHLAAEISAMDDAPSAVFITPRKMRDAPIPTVSAGELMSGAPAALHVAAADCVLVARDLLPHVAYRLPENLLSATDLVGADAIVDETSVWTFRQRHWLARKRPFSRSVRDRGRDLTTHEELEQYEQEWLSRRDWAQEVAWRITRVHELKRSKNARVRERQVEDINRLLPASKDIGEYIDAIAEIGLPSILEVVQEGIGTHNSKRQCALTVGFRAMDERYDFARDRGQRLDAAWDLRFADLSYQHRMHADIAAFPREVVYDHDALLDANTIDARDAEIQWDFRAGFSGRRVWLDVWGHESGGVNKDEILAMEAVVKQFVEWAKRRGPPNRARPANWEIACLSFYLKQEGAIREMLGGLTDQRDRFTRFSMPNVDITCGTVDRFQGREADMVLISMRNTGRVGFLDSVNRLNVGVTRARQQLVVVGKAQYFKKCDIAELEALVKKTRVIDYRKWKAQR